MSMPPMDPNMPPQMPQGLNPNVLKRMVPQSLLGNGLKISAFTKPNAIGMVGSQPLKNGQLADKNNLSLDLQQKDWKVVPGEQPEEDRKIVDFVKTQFDTAYRSRSEMEIEWAMASAFFEARQWFRINTNSRNLVNLQNPNEPNRYITVNKIRPLIDGVIGKLTQCSPDATAVALSDAEHDRAAADEANYLIHHYNRKFNRETQLKERVRWACVTGTSYLKIFWDTKREQVVPQFDISGQQIIGHEQMAVGDVVEQILPCFDVYIDPSAKRDDDVRWMIHAMIKPLSWFVDSYGDIGKRVQPDAVMGHNSGYIDSYLEGANGSGRGWVPPSTARINNYDTRKLCAVVYEYWEKPSALYPKGRYIVSSNGVLLYGGIWPYDKRDAFPFIPLRWQPRSGTPYGYSLGFDLCALQSTYNRIYSRLLEQFESQKDYIMIERLSNVGADAYDNQSDTIEDKNRIYRKVYFNRGSHPPVIQRAPGIGGDLFPLLQMVEKDMMDIAGLHDVSQGMAQAGTPAESVRLLQKADNTQHSYIRADIEISNARIKEWEVALVNQFAIVPFVGNIQGNGLPSDKIEQGVMRFDAIRNGGQFRIVYVPGSSLDEGPDARLQKYATLRQMGVFGDPADPETNKLFVEMVNMPESSKILEHLEMQNQKVQQMQAQQQQVGEQQMAMQQQQHEMAMAQAAQAQQQQQLSDFNPEEEQFKMQLKLQEELALIRAKLEADIALETAKAGIASNAQEEQSEAQMNASLMGGNKTENRSTM